MATALDPEIYRFVLESLPEGVYLVDRERRIVLWNEGAERITGHLRQEVIGRLCHDNLLMHCDHENTILCGAGCPLAGTMQDGKPREANVFLRHKDGQRVPIRVRAVPIRDAAGIIIGAAETFDERVLPPEIDLHANSQAVRDSLDTLVGVPDRKSTERHIGASLEDFGEYHVPFGVLSIAIDKLEEIRHSRGSMAAEAIVRVVARTLSKNLHWADVVGRWSQDRFVAIVENCTEAALIRVAELWRRLICLAAVPWWGDRVSVTVSIGGTAVRPDDTAESLLSRAEAALGASLAEGGDRVMIR